MKKCRQKMTKYQIDRNGCTLNDVDKLRGVSVRRQVEAVGLHGSPDEVDAGALELLMVGVPRLYYAALALHSAVGLARLEPAQLALVAQLELLGLTGEAGMEEESREEAEGIERDQQRRRLGHYLLPCFDVFERGKRSGF